MKILISILGLIFFNAVAAAEAIDIADDKGVIVHFPDSPKRIVSMLPSITESVCILGKCDLLVGIDRYSNSPPSVSKLPQLGGGLDPNIEAILSLRPDLVLVGSSSRASERLRSLGLTVFSLEAKTYADVQRVLEKLSTILGVSNDEAKNIWMQMNKDISSIAASLPEGSSKVRVYFEVNRAPFAAGPGSFIGETLERLGVENIIPAALGPFPKINPEFVVRANPDVIMVGDRNYLGMVDRPGWSDLKAIKEGRICVFNEQESDVIVRPGPRIPEAAKVIARCLAEKAYSATPELNVHQ
ncbi:MAG: helical backbone metal receptor [Sheuella sp.]|nr:helical backbone metal receptor [Sheuella sp.]